MMWSVSVSPECAATQISSRRQVHTKISVNPDFFSRDVICKQQAGYREGGGGTVMRSVSVNPHTVLQHRYRAGDRYSMVSMNLDSFSR